MWLLALGTHWLHKTDLHNVVNAAFGRHPRFAVAAFGPFMTDDSFAFCGGVKLIKLSSQGIKSRLEAKLILIISPVTHVTIKTNNLKSFNWLSFKFKQYL